MSPKILVIESDAAFARELTESLQAAGFECRGTTDGKEGLDLAREYAPDAIILCVELPKMSGYVICQKLKKDDALKGIPLLLTSSEATEETFEKHRQLKVRAEEYLIKPFEPAALIGVLGNMGLSGGDASGGEEEVVSLEEEMGLEAMSGEPESDLPALDLDTLPDEPSAHGGAPAGVDDDLRLLDDAFDGLAAPAPARGAPESEALAEGVGVELEVEGEKPVTGDDVDAAAASLPDLDEAPARADISRIDEEADRALGALAGGEPEPTPFENDPYADAPTARAPIRGASVELLRSAGIPVMADAPTAASWPDAGGAPAAELDGERATGGAERDAELRALRARFDALSSQAKKAEVEAKAARDEARRNAERFKASEDRARAAEDRARGAQGEAAEARRRTEIAEEDIAEARRRADSAEEQRSAEANLAAEAAAKADALEREIEELKTELVVARGEADGARGEVEKRTGEVMKRLQDVEAMSAKNEERVLKAYQKIKADEKVKDKVRKALSIALQLLEEGLPAESAPAERARAAAAEVTGRE